VAQADGAILYSIYFFVAVLLILICGNVGLLLFARAASREVDLVVRTALGASRARIVAQSRTSENNDSSHDSRTPSSAGALEA